MHHRVDIKLRNFADFFISILQFRLHIILGVGKDAQICVESQRPHVFRHGYSDFCILVQTAPNIRMMTNLFSPCFTNSKCNPNSDVSRRCKCLTNEQLQFRTQIIEMKQRINKSRRASLFLNKEKERAQKHDE
ncbi:hypothetical protein T01_11070 [Trichinella spiralis]|uniref:Uncharacterized protein n=1 Tax=Trichinella spiralis TaxID=6334 RepID=A0A0V1AWT9_TRISP|nr:hypothetical protein T01_11070 [Trichinella spiralis]